MARIKFLQDDFAGFRGSREPKRKYAGDVLQPLEAVQTIRAGVQLAQDVGSAFTTGADFLTRAGVIGRQPTEKDLIEEAAKKKAEETAKQREAERAKMLSQRQAEEQKIQAEMQQRTSVAVAPEVEAMRASRVALENAVADLNAGKIKPEEFQRIYDIEKARGALSADELKTVEEALKPLRESFKRAGDILLQEQEAEQKIKARTGQVGPAMVGMPSEERMKVIQQAIAGDTQALNSLNEEETRVANALLDPNSPESQTIRLAELRKEREAETQKFAGFKAPAGLLKYGETPEEQKRKGVEAFARAQQYVEKLDKNQAEMLFQRLSSIPSRDRAEDEDFLMQTLQQKYPEFRTPSTTFGPRRGVLREGFDVSKTYSDFVAGAEERKEAVRKLATLSTQQKEEELRKIDAALAAAQKDPDRSGMIFAKALTAIDQLYKNDREVSKEELLAKKQQLQDIIGNAPAELAALDAQEDARTDAIKRASMGFLATLTELQQLNQKKATKGLTEQEALRAFQLKQFMDDNKALVQQLQSADIATDKNVSEMVIQLNRMVQEGKAPPLETQEARNSRLDEALSSFDAATQNEIKKAANAEAQAVANTLIDADQLKLLAAQAALTGDAKSAGKVIAFLASGNVVGQQPRTFTEWLSGDYKRRYNAEVIETLFTRARGKSDQEIAIALKNLELKNINTIRQVEGTLAEVEKKAQALKEAQATELTRKEKLEAETRAKQAEAKIKEFKATDEFLKKEYDKLSGQADIALADAKTRDAYNLARINYLNKVGTYYAGRNATAIAVAKAGQVQKGIQDTGDNLGDQATDVDKSIELERKTYDKYSQFERYFTRNPQTGKLERTPEYDKEFPSAANKAAYNAKVLELGGGSRGKDALEARRKEALAYEDRFGKPGGPDLNKDHKLKMEVYNTGKAALRDLQAFSQSTVVGRTEANAPRKLQKIAEAAARIQKLMTEASAGKAKEGTPNATGAPPTDSTMAEINKIVTDTKREVQGM